MWRRKDKFAYLFHYVNALNASTSTTINISSFLVTGQCAKKVVSDSLRLVDFANRLVKSALNLPNRQVKFFGNSNYRRDLINPALQKIFRAS